MGYERKRGKLAELNALLRGGAADALLARSSGDTAVLRTSSTSSRWTPIPSCRATPPGNWWGPWRIR